MIGKSFAHFEILSLLGKGGMGEVYRAHDTKLGRDVVELDSATKNPEPSPPTRVCALPADLWGYSMSNDHQRMIGRFLSKRTPSSPLRYVVGWARFR